MIMSRTHWKPLTIRPVLFRRSTCEATFTITTCIIDRIYSATISSLPIFTPCSYHEQIQRGKEYITTFHGSVDSILVADYEAIDGASVSVRITQDLLGQLMSTEFIASLSMTSYQIPSASNLPIANNSRGRVPSKPFYLRWVDHWIYWKRHSLPVAMVFACLCGLHESQPEYRLEEGQKIVGSPIDLVYQNASLDHERGLPAVLAHQHNCGTMARKARKIHPKDIFACSGTNIPSYRKYAGRQTHS